MKSESGYPCMPPSFVNRSEELSRIQRAYESESAEFIRKLDSLVGL